MNCLRIQSDSLRAVAEPIIESPVIVQEAAATANFEGIGVTYTLPAPVTIRAQSEELEIALDTLSMDATLSARAIPRFDDTAFRLANVTNTSTEILLPGRALLYVEGQLVGNTQVGVLPPNAEADIFFGRIDGLRLTRTVLDRNEGDRGIITRSNEKTEDVRIEVENLTSQAWDVTLRDVVPYSEQEDLVIDWSGFRLRRTLARCTISAVSLNGNCRCLLGKHKASRSEPNSPGPRTRCCASAVEATVCARLKTPKPLPEGQVALADVLKFSKVTRQPIV